MSFILDALKKLEQNRKRGEVPDLTTVHLHDHGAPKKRAVWPYLLLAALLLNAGVFAVWLKPWEDKEAIIAQPEINEAEEVAVTEPATDEASEASTLKVASIIENKETAVAAPEVNKEVKEEIIEAVVEPEKSDEEIIASMGLNPSPEELDILRNKIQEEQQVPEQMPVAEVLMDIIGPEDKSGFVDISQLPEDVKRELPEININAHIYSDNKAARIVTINGYVTREGDKISSELILDEITTAGVIFSYKEYRFRVRVF